MSYYNKCSRLPGSANRVSVVKRIGERSHVYTIYQTVLGVLSARLRVPDQAHRRYDEWPFR